MVDRIDELKSKAYAVGRKCISLSDDVFEHHFPGQPIYPGALLVESMAQLGGAMLEISLRQEDSFTPRCVLAKVTAKFRDFAKPGDQLMMRVDVQSLREDSAMVNAVCSRQDKRVCQAEMMFVFLQVEDQALEDSRRSFLDLITRETRFVE